MNPDFLRAKFEAGLPYDQYVRSGTPQQLENWNRIYEQAALSPRQQQSIGSFRRTIKVLGLSGIWCGDCVQQCPLVQRICEANREHLQVRWLDRDAHGDLQDRLVINGGHRIPIILFCAEDFHLAGWHGDRTLHRYRALAARNLGAACPLPGAPVPGEELKATAQDWLDQIERIYLLLRLSARLRQKHGD